MSKNGLLILIAAVAAFGGLLFGYDTGVINGAQFYLTKNFELSSGMKGWVVSSALLGCLVGALAAGPLTNRLGRKFSLILAAALFTISAWGSGLPSFLPQEVWLLVVFRILGGLGIGLASMAAPTYIAEIAPKEKRGVLVTFYQLAVVTGFFVVFLATYFIGSGNTEEQNIATGWRWMFWSELIPCSLFFILTFFIPRSPRWLISVGKEEEAMKVLKSINNDQAAQAEFDEIKLSLVKKELVETKKINLFQSAVLPIIIIGSVLSLFQQFTGINAVLYYGGDIFEKALGFTSEDVLQQQILLGGVNFVFTFLAMFTVDRLGRKPLIYIGGFGMISGFLLLGGTLFFEQVGLLSLIGVLLFIGAFAMSMGPVTWVMLSEMFPNKIRSAGMSIAVAIQWLGNFFVSQTFPVVAESKVNEEGIWNNSLPYLIFIVFIAGLMIFTYKYLIETKGKSLEELEGIWAKRYGEIKE
ncbi:MAG: sugar porter family MFS transporter [Cyclobacteriaceae bacterium]|nr:sugar porter family MFS transporter [Cyclobacteriaceae bacterium]MCH8517033.1 sugar porter family MFS transporter [Cyclobacteriaceae bacterium]